VLPGRGGPSRVFRALWVHTVLGAVSNRQYLGHGLNRFASVDIGQVHQALVALGTSGQFTWINRRRRMV